MDDDGVLGSVSFVGLISVCCLGLGGLAAGAALAGGSVGTTAMATGVTDARGAVISGAVTLLTVLVAVTLIRWRLD